MAEQRNESSAATVDLSRVDRLHRCTGCGYLALSSPDFTIYDDDGKEVGGGQHECPECGEACWHWCGGDDRAARIRHLQEFLRGR